MNKKRNPHIYYQRFWYSDEIKPTYIFWHQREASEKLENIEIIHFVFRLKSQSPLKYIWYVYWRTQSYLQGVPSKGWVLEFLDFFVARLIVMWYLPDFNFVDFNHCQCKYPVFKVSKMGCNISLGQNSSEILQFKEMKRNLLFSFS